MPVTVPKVPRFVRLTPEREEKIDKFLERLRAEYDPLPYIIEFSRKRLNCDPDAPTTHNPERLFAYSYLLSRRWNLEDAYNMMKKLEAYQTQSNFKGLHELPSAVSLRGWDEQKVMDFIGSEPRVQPGRCDKLRSGIGPHLQFGIHYWDKNGQPVFYLMLGNTDEAGLLKKLKQLATVGQKPIDVIWEYVQHGIGVGEELCFYQQHLCETGELASDGVDVSEGTIRAITMVVDCAGLNYKMLWKPAVDLFMEAGKMLTMYPDCLHRIMAINTPGMVMFAYNIVKGSLDEGVRRKVSFYSPKETLEAMSQVIDVKHIPRFLGGECECENHCIAHYDPEHPKNVDVDDANEADVITEDIKLKAGKKHVKIFHLQKDETVFWDFATTEGKDVSFGLYFIPSTDDMSQEQKFSLKELQPYTVHKDRPATGTDLYRATEDGTAVLTWDNKRAWFGAKQVQMRVYMQAEDGIHNSASVLVPAVSSGNYVPPAEALDPNIPAPRGGVKEEEKREAEHRQQQQQHQHQHQQAAEEENGVKGEESQGGGAVVANGGNTAEIKSVDHNAEPAAAPKSAKEQQRQEKKAKEEAKKRDKAAKKAEKEAGKRALD